MPSRNDAVILDVIRTPTGRARPEGALSHFHPVDLLAEVLRALADRAQLDTADIDDVIGGVVTQIGEQGGNLARQATLAAGYEESVPATTVDRKCGSSQQAVHFAAQGVMAGSYDLVVAGGLEMLSRVPMQSNTAGADHLGPAVRLRYPSGLVSQGIAAEMVAKKWGLTREQLDTFSAESHRRAASATESGRFLREMLPLPGRNGESITADEGVRPTTSVESLARLNPAFETAEARDAHPDLLWIVTAGSSSQISDGASAALVGSLGAAERNGIAPRARFVSFAVSGDDPRLMLTGIMPATRSVLERAGLSVKDIDLFEVNEAFAPVVLAWQQEFQVPLERVNVNGGAIALGHPLGASGTRLLATLLNELEARDARYGLQVMCEAGGQANAMIIERLHL